MVRQDASGNDYYYFADPLGTVKGIVSGTTLCYDADFYPFGGEKVFTNTCAQNYKFTGLERDTESGLDDTLYRMYSSGLGRWLSPDPLRGHTGNPQSLNRYAYVDNNPSNATDLSGLDAADFFPSTDPIYNASNDSYSPPWAWAFEGASLGAGGYAEVSTSQDVFGGNGEGGETYLGTITSTSYLPTSPNGPSGGGSGGCQRKYRNFFNLMVPIANALGKKWNCDPNFILALSAAESGWDPVYSGPTHQQPINDPFGLTNAGGLDLTFPTLQAAADYWSSNSGRYIKGATTIQAFAADLQPHYNVKDPNWTTNLINVYSSVVTRRKLCGQ